MRRQKIRKLCLLISLLVFPITLYYLSPYIIIAGAMEGIVAGSFITFGLMIVLSIFLGRGFCSFICPAGAIQEAAQNVNDKPAKVGKRKYIKYGIWIVWITIIAILCIRHGRIEKVDPFFMTDHGISVSEIGGYIVYYMVIFIILLTSLFCGRRAFCHYFCWMAPFMIIGTKIREKLHLPGLHLEVEPEKCINCKKCTKNCAMSLNMEEQVRNGKIDCTDCILCGKCVDGCPKHAIHYSFKGSLKDGK